MPHNKEQEKKNREYLKRTTRCISCSKRDAYTIAGRSYCFDCAKKYLKINAIYRESHREDINKKNRTIRKERKESGLCVDCGKELPKNSSFTRCDICKAKRRSQKKKYDLKKGVNYPRGGNGICWTCNKEPAMEGKKLCETCYQRQLKILEEGPNRKKVS